MAIARVELQAIPVLRTLQTLEEAPRRIEKRGHAQVKHPLNNGDWTIYFLSEAMEALWNKHAQLCCFPEAAIERVLFPDRVSRIVCAHPKYTRFVDISKTTNRIARILLLTQAAWKLHRLHMSGACHNNLTPSTLLEIDGAVFFTDPQQDTHMKSSRGHSPKKIIGSRLGLTLSSEELQANDVYSLRLIAAGLLCPEPHLIRKKGVPNREVLSHLRPEPVKSHTSQALDSLLYSAEASKARDTAAHFFHELFTALPEAARETLFRKGFFIEPLPPRLPSLGPKMIDSTLQEMSLPSLILSASWEKESSVATLSVPGEHARHLVKKKCSLRECEVQVLMDALHIAPQTYRIFPPLLTGGYIVMERMRLSGEDFTRKNTSKLRALLIGIKVAGLVAKMNRAGFLHLDIKPDNIVVTPDKKDPSGLSDRVRLIDFSSSSHVWTTMSLSPERAEYIMRRKTPPKKILIEDEVYALALLILTMITKTRALIPVDLDRRNVKAIHAFRISTSSVSSFFNKHMLDAFSDERGSSPLPDALAATLPEALWGAVNPEGYLYDTSETFFRSLSSLIPSPWQRSIIEDVYPELLSGAMPTHASASSSSSREAPAGAGSFSATQTESLTE